MPHPDYVFKFDREWPFTGWRFLCVGGPADGECHKAHCGPVLHVPERLEQVFLEEFSLENAPPVDRAWTTHTYDLACDDRLGWIWKYRERAS